MKLFRYRVRQVDGKIIESQMWGQQASEVADKLKGEGGLVISLEERSLKGQGHKEKWPLKDLLRFSYEIFILLEAGLPLRRIISLLQEQHPKDQLYEYLGEALQRGQALSEALQDRHFPPLALTLLEAGEATGSLGEAFSHIYRHYSEVRVQQRARREAMTYPILLAVLSILFLGVAIGWILPTFAVMLRTLQVPLPTVTRFLLNVGEFFQNYGVEIFVCAIFLVLGGCCLLKNHYFRYQVDKWYWQHLIRKESIGTFYYARILMVWSRLLRAGLPLLEVLGLTGGLWLNCYGQDCQKAVIRHIRQGEGLAEALQAENIGTSFIWELTALGEESGELVTMLEHGAGYYQRQADSLRKKWQSMLEPALLCFMGGIVALIVVSVLLPMFTAISSITV